MGLNEKSGGNAVFLNIIKGDLRQKVKEGTEGAKSRLNKNEETVHELIYGSCSGRIAKVASRDTDFGKEIQITMNDGGMDYKIGIPFQSDLFIDFAKRLLNFSAEEIGTKNIVLSPFQMPNGEYYNSFVGLTLEGEESIRKVKYTKDEPGKMPQWEKYTDQGTGEEKWSSLEQRKWLAGQVAALMQEAEKLMPKQEATPKPEAAAEETPAAPVEQATKGSDKEDLDDLPF